MEDKLCRDCFYYGTCSSEDRLECYEVFYRSDELDDGELEEYIEERRLQHGRFWPVYTGEMPEADFHFNLRGLKKILGR